MITHCFHSEKSINFSVAIFPYTLQKLFGIKYTFIRAVVQHDNVRASCGYTAAASVTTISEFFVVALWMLTDDR